MKLLRADHRVSPADVEHLVREVLDSIDITDVVYHGFEYTRPLVEGILLQVMNHVEPGGRVAVLGGNSLLAHAIRAAGYDLHLWRFGENLLADDLEPYIRGRVTPEQLRDGCVLGEGGCFDAIVLPLVFEYVPANPGTVIKALAEQLHRDSVIIVATRNLGALNNRKRALTGRPYLPDWRPPEILFSMNWPDLQPYRYYLTAELLDAAREAGFVPAEAGYAIGHNAYNATDVVGLRGFGSLMAQHWIKQAVPSLRDLILVTFRAASTEERRRNGVPAATGPEGAATSEPLEQRPLVSVVIATKNRAGMLRDCLSGLLCQTYPAGKLEAIIVNDGSTDGTAEVAREFSATAPFPVRCITTTGVGAIRARNLGMREAGGEIVAHLDDDNRPAPEWIEEGVRGFANNVAIVGGPIVPKPEQPSSFFSLPAWYLEDLGIYPSSSIFFRRDLALAFGGFDETFGGNVVGRPVFGWDADLGWRMRRAGYESRFRPGAVTYQEVVTPGLRGWFKDAWRSVTLPMAVQRVPELGQYLLYRRFFIHQTTLYFDLAVAGAVLALAKRHPLPLLLGAPYAATIYPGIAPDRWPPKRWPKLGAKLSLTLARQGVTLAALVVGSLKAKRGVL